jgi:hypothetical protein
MVSITGITGNYVLQPVLLEKHRKTLDWLSSSILWKSELAFFQKTLDERASSFTAVADKKQIDHFQNLIIYYNGELIDEFRKTLREHESHLADMLAHKDEANTVYFKEHDTIMDQLESFSKVFTEFRTEFLDFIKTK